MGRVALYARVSTQDQSVENQLVALRDWARARGHEVVGEYTDEGISGAKGRDKRPALDALMKDATRGKFDMLAATALDRLGRNLRHLVGLFAELDALRVDVFVQNMALDTSTPVGRLTFNVMGAFAEFERELTRERTRLALDRARRNGKRLGRPTVGPTTERQIVALLEAKTPISKITRLARVGKSTVYRIQEAMTA